MSGGLLHSECQGDKISEAMHVAVLGSKLIDVFFLEVKPQLFAGTEHYILIVSQVGESSIEDQIVVMLLALRAGIYIFEAFIEPPVISTL